MFLLGFFFLGLCLLGGEGIGYPIFCLFCFCLFFGNTVGKGGV